MAALLAISIVAAAAVFLNQNVPGAGFEPTGPETSAYHYEGEVLKKTAVLETEKSQTVEPVKEESDGAHELGGDRIEYKGARVVLSTPSRFEFELDLSASKEMSFQKSDLSVIAKYAQNSELTKFAVEQFKERELNRTFFEYESVKSGEVEKSHESNGTWTEDVFESVGVERWEIVKEEYWDSEVDLNGSFKRVRVVAERKVSFGFQSVDIVPKLGGFEFHEFAWWNSSFSFKKEQDVTSNLASGGNGFIYVVNWTKTANDGVNCNDNRWINGTEDTSRAIYNEFCAGSGSQSYTWVNDSLSPGTGGQTRYRYYGNSTVENVSLNPSPFGANIKMIYTFEGNTSNIVDSANSGANSGTVGYNSTQGRHNRAADFLAGGHIDLDGDLWFDPVDNAWSWAGWVKFHAPGASNIGILEFTSSLIDGGIDLNGREGSGWLSAGCHQTRMTTEASFVPAAETWYHIAFTFAGGTNGQGRLYLDGNQVDADTANSCGGGGSIARFDLAQFQGSTDANIALDGVVFTNNVLSADQVMALANVTNVEGSEESEFQITVDQPQNSTYNASTVATEFFVDSLISPLEVRAFLDGALVYDNATYGAGFVVTNTTGSLSIGAHNFTVRADDGSSVITETVLFTVAAGTAFSPRNGGNGTQIGGFGVYLANGTVDFQRAGLSFGDSIANSLLPQGANNVTFFRHLFKNATVTGVPINSTGFAEASAFMYRLQELNASTFPSGPALSSFQVTAANSTFTGGPFSSSGSRVVVGLDELPLGNSQFTVQATGFVTNVSNITLTGSSELNRTFFLSDSVFTITNVFDEATNQPICYNFTMQSGAAFHSNSSCGTFTASTLNVPTGEPVTLTITNGSYFPRTYLPDVTTVASTTVTGYLVSQDDGYVVRFHMVNFFGVPVIGGSAVVNATVGGSNVIVSEANADGTGTVSIFMDPLRTYALVFSAPGFDDVSQSLQPTSQDYNVVMGEGAKNVTGPVSQQYLWSVRASGGIYGNGTLIPINFTYVDYASITTFFGLNISYNGTQIFNQTNASQSGSIFVLVNTSGRSGQVFAQAFALREVPGLLSQTYVYTIVRGSDDSGLSFGNFPGFSTLAEATEESGLSHPFTDIVALFIVILVMAGFSRLPWHLTGASMIGLVVLGAFIYFGWVSFSQDPVWGGTITWGTYLAFWVAAVMVMFVIRRL